jgi:hypothetical protein
MKLINYFECRYGDDTQGHKKEWWDYPCMHPLNKEHKCNVRNKKENQKDVCPYLNR